MASIEKASPGSHSIALGPQPKPAREIVAASSRDHQKGDFQPGEIRQIMMDGSVSAQNYGGVGGGHRLSALVADDLAGGTSEQGQAFGRYVRTEDGNGAHARRI